MNLGLLSAQCFGLKPGWHHLTSQLFHAASTVVLFLLLQQMTGAAWRSAAVAALLALHPLHVESVAWVAERKDVLGASFFMLTLWAYGRSGRAAGVVVSISPLLFLCCCWVPPISNLCFSSLPYALFLLKVAEVADVRNGRRSRPGDTASSD